MIFSGLLMYGASQKKRVIGWTFFIVLFIYLFSLSQSAMFFAINMFAIFFVTAGLKKINCQALSGAAILLYSVVIDIICYFFVPVFSINVPLMTYIMNGILFNIRSGMPAIVLGMMMQVFVIAKYLIRKKGALIIQNAQCTMHNAQLM